MYAIRSYYALVFLPLSFLTGLMGVNLGGIPGADSHWGFLGFCLLLGLSTFAIFIWLKLKKWL